MDIFRTHTSLLNRTWSKVKVCLPTISWKNCLYHLSTFFFCGYLKRRIMPPKVKIDMQGEKRVHSHGQMSIDRLSIQTRSTWLTLCIIVFIIFTYMSEPVTDHTATKKGKLWRDMIAHIVKEHGT